MLDKQAYSLRREIFPLGSQEHPMNEVYKQKRRQRVQRGGGAISLIQEKGNEYKETGTWPESILTQNFEHIIEKRDDNREATKRTRRNMVDEGRQRFMALAEIFAKKLERAKRGKFTFLLVGRTDAGRIDPVNALLGEEVITGDEQVPDTLQVTAYEREIAGIKFSIVDTPGFCDVLAEKAKDYIYLTRLQDGAPRFDSLWFVTPLLDAGITDGEKRAIEMITRAYGSDAWRYALIVFTYAGTLEPGMSYQELYEQKMKRVRQEIARFVGEEIAIDIPAVAVASKAKGEFNNEGWLSELYLTVATRMSDQGYLSFLLATARRLKFSMWENSKNVIPYAMKGANSVNNLSMPSESEKEYISINEEKEQKMEQRMRDYLINVAKRNSILF